MKLYNFYIIYWDIINNIRIKCEDFTEEERCLKYHPLDTRYKCIFKGGNCIKGPKICINFEYDVINNKDGSNKIKCESITSVEEYYNGKVFGKFRYKPTVYHKCDSDSFL